jgi:hypothetical protein
LLPWGFPRIFPSFFHWRLPGPFFGWYWTLIVKSPFKKFNLWSDTPPTHSSIHPSIHSSCPTNRNQGVFFFFFFWVLNINKISWIYTRNTEISQNFFVQKIIAGKISLLANWHFLWIST